MGMRTRALRAGARARVPDLQARPYRIESVLAEYPAAAVLAALPQAEPAQEWHDLLGRSHRGRPIRVHRYGDFSSPRKLLVVGCIHGDECEGIEVTRRLARGPVPPGSTSGSSTTSTPTGGGSASG